MGTGEGSKKKKVKGGRKESGMRMGVGSEDTMDERDREVMGMSLWLFQVVRRRLHPLRALPRPASREVSQAVSTSSKQTRNGTNYGSDDSQPASSQ